MSSRIESTRKLGKKEYARELRRLQIELVKLHRHVIARGRKVLVILEGRDAAGKDGTIKRIAAHLSPREVRIVAPGKPATANRPNGTSSATSGICPQPRKSCCSIAAGTTAPAWSTS